MSKIAIVAIDMNVNDRHFFIFNQLSAVEKIEKLKQRIDEICVQLKQKEPDALWLITWREYGIAEPRARNVSPEIKVLFKKTMEALAKQYAPHLVIFAGTIATRRYVSNLEKLNAIKTYYAQHAWIKDIEEDQAKNYPGTLKNIEIEEKKIEALQKEKSRKGFICLRNTMYVFTGSETLRHDKMTPQKEDYGFTHKEEVIFQPAKGRNLAPWVIVQHPITHKKFKIGAEICREQAFATLHNYIKKNNLENPDLHLVISASVSLSLSHLCGGFVVPLDSLYKPRLITQENDNSNLNVKLYQNNLLHKSAELMGPLQPEYPIERKVVDNINNVLAKFKSCSIANKPYLEELIELRNNFFKHLEEFKQWQRQEENVASKAPYKKHLSDLANDIMAFEEKFNSPTSFGIFQRSPDTQALLTDCKELVKNLRSLIKEDQLKLIQENYYLGKGDAPPLDKLQLYEKLFAENKPQLALECAMTYHLFPQIKFTIERALLMMGVLFESPLSDDIKAPIFEKIFADIPSCMKFPHPLFYSHKTMLGMIVIGNMHTALIKALPFCKEQINAQIYDGDTILQKAIKNGVNKEIIETLLLNGADVAITDADNESAVTIAKLYHPDVADLISEYDKSTRKKISP